MEPQEALEQLARARTGERVSPGELREASEAIALIAGRGVRGGARRSIGEVNYGVEEVTWPVSRFDDGSQAFHSPRPKPALLRGDALIADVREDYWDGWATYRPVGEKVGRWRRFRMGSPGDRGYDLHLATDEELTMFASEAAAVLDSFGVAAVDGQEDQSTG